MTAGNLGGWLDGERERLRWIDFSAYAKRVFAADSGAWLTDANVFVGGVAQAQGVIGTEVLSLDIIAPYLAMLEPDADAPADAIQALFELEAPAQFCHDTIDALAHSFAANIDIVLKLRSPSDLLRAAGFVGEPSFDDLDDIAIALSNRLRALAEKPVSGIVITTTSPFSADESEALESVVSAARHYDWRVCVSFEGDSEPDGGDAALDGDANLYPQAAFAALAPAGGAGGGLGDHFWRDDAALAAPGRVLMYGEIPADAEPEFVVARATAIAAN